MNTYEYKLDTTFTEKELAQILGLDPRTIRKHRHLLGGKPLGRHCFYVWGNVMRYWNNADFNEEPRQCLASTSLRERAAGSEQNVPCRKEARPRMESRKGVGRRAEKNVYGEKDDSFGLRAALGVG